MRPPEEAGDQGHLSLSGESGAEVQAAVRHCESLPLESIGEQGLAFGPGLRRACFSKDDTNDGLPVLAAGGYETDAGLVG